MKRPKYYWNEPGEALYAVYPDGYRFYSKLDQAWQPAHLGATYATFFAEHSDYLPTTLTDMRSLYRDLKAAPPTLEDGTQPASSVSGEQQPTIS